MRTAKILTYDDILPIQEGDSREPLVDVRTYDNSIMAQYEKFDMVPYAGFDILVRDTVARKLAAVNARLKAKYTMALKIVYGYRTTDVQKNYFETMQAKLSVENPSFSPDELRRLTHNFVAAPEIAGHITGGAIDVTLATLDGTLCEMGTGIADYRDEDRIKTFAQKITAEQSKNRQILLGAMVDAGFAPFYGEWWHFSYGDKEWAAYYKNPKAIYSPLTSEKTVISLKIAGGNETVLRCIKGTGLGRPMASGKALLDAFPSSEQAGLLYVDNNKLEMAGGEFCGNASAAAAVLLAREQKKPTVRYRVSGFDGNVVATVTPLTEVSYQVRTSFAGMSYAVKNLRYENMQIKLVDMDGIVHVLIEGVFPTLNYASFQRKLITDLGLSKRDAVGVIWYSQQFEKVKIDPVVWVKKVNTLYYESACGSGSIAVSLATGAAKIQQPTGQCIEVDIDKNKVTTECEILICI